MERNGTLRRRLLYVVAVLAMLAMMIPLATAPVSAATPTFTATSVHDIIGDIERFTVNGLTGNLNVTNFIVSDTPNGNADAFIVNMSPLPGGNGSFVDVEAFGWGEAAVIAVLSDNSTLTAFKKWGKIDYTIIQGPQNIPLIWNESQKFFEASANITDTVFGTFLLEDPINHQLKQFHEPVAGVPLRWFLFKDNPATQAWLAQLLNQGTPPGWATPAFFLGQMNQAQKDFGVPTFTTFDNGLATAESTTGAKGTSTIFLRTSGEEPVLIVVIPLYPNAPGTELQVPLEWTKLNFWTPEYEKVPQVRWAGEKIVLEKFFGIGTRPDADVGAPPTDTENWVGTLVRFTLENQSPGALEGIAYGGNLGNLTNTAQTVWSIVGPDGYARVMLVSEAPGECDVDLAVYNINVLEDPPLETLEDMVNDPAIIINQHGFVVFYLKLEDISLGSVSGNRTMHNAGLWNPPNPWDVATDNVTDILNVSEDNLLRARVRGWFVGDNLSTRPEREVDFDPNTDSDHNGIPDDDADLLLPRGRWILPDDWERLAGPDWQEQRLHWDIMDNPSDTVRSPAPTDADTSPGLAGYHGSGPYYKPLPGPKPVLKADYPVIGPFRPGIEEPTWYGYNPNILPFAVPPQKSVVPNDLLEWWDAPMPPAKITFEITSGNGFFKDAWKSDIYYSWANADRTGKLYTNPFYFEMIPAHPQIPAFVNNGGYDWDSWAGVTVLPNGQVLPPKGATPVAWAQYGPYEFWKIFNRPLPAAVSSSDVANFPTKVQVYSDNHGEAMVYVNGNWNLNLGPFLSNGAADIPFGATVGRTTVVAMSDYPYFRKHPKMVSTNVTKFWTWGGMVLGTDQVLFPGGDISESSPMVLTTGTYTITGGIYPNEVGTSPKKLVWLWLTDRDISPWGVMDTRIRWSVNGGGTVKIADFGYVKGVSIYNDVTRAIELQNGFLFGTNGVVDVNTGGTSGVSGVRAPNKTEKDLFKKFYPTLDPDDFVVGAVELLTSSPTISVTLQALITSRSFGMSMVDNPATPFIDERSGTIIRNLIVDFSAAYPLDDKPLYGDANSDGIIDMTDVISIERIILGLRLPYVGADANIDHSFDVADVIKTERIILGLD